MTDLINTLIACADGRSPPERCPSAGELKEAQLLDDPRLDTAFGFDADALRNVGHFNSHYTSPDIALAIREGVRRILGRNPKSVLDPGCGSGNFYQPGVGYVGVDLCPVSAQIARQRCVDGKIYTADFLSWRYPLKFEAVWGNVPFTDGVQRQRLGLHAHFFKKAISLLAPGGVLALMTSTSTMDAKGAATTQFRKEVDLQCEFLGAMRLPPGCHVGKTQATSDVIVLRKRETPHRGTPGTWVNTGLWRVEDENEIHCNLWWMSDGADFLFGRTVVDDLRGSSGGRCYRMALRPDSECVPSRIRTAMDAMGDRSTLGRIVQLLMPTQIPQGETIMPASKIPDGEFPKKSGLAPLVRIHNSGCEIHFHSEVTPHSAVLATLTERGFVQSKTNLSMYYKGEGNFAADGEYVLRWLTSSGAKRYNGEVETVRAKRRRKKSAPPSVEDTVKAVLEEEIPAIAAAVAREVLSSLPSNDTLLLEQKLEQEKKAHQEAIDEMAATWGKLEEAQEEIKTLQKTISKLEDKQDILEAEQKQLLVNLAQANQKVAQLERENNLKTLVGDDVPPPPPPEDNEDDIPPPPEPGDDVPPPPEPEENSEDDIPPPPQEDKSPVHVTGEPSDDLDELDVIAGE